MTPRTPTLAASADFTSATRLNGTCWYTCFRWDPTQPVGQRVQDLGAYVVDDYGTLVRITGDTFMAAERFYFSHSQGQEEAAAQWVEDQARADASRQRADFEATNTRKLLRPEPIVVEIGAGETEHGDIEVQVGPDARTPGTPGPPLYRVTVAGNDHIWITHAQLAALGLAAQHLCRSPRGRSAH
jgi:hypothetical protein